MVENKQSSRQISDETRNCYVAAMEQLGVSPTNIAAAKGELPLGKRKFRRRIARYFTIAYMAKIENR